MQSMNKEELADLIFDLRYQLDELRASKEVQQYLKLMETVVKLENIYKAQ